MAPKRSAPSTPTASSGNLKSAVSSPTSPSSASASSSFPSGSASSSSSSSSSNSDAALILTHIWDRYVKNTPQRTKLLDAFLAFLVAVGVVQFVYCVLAGNYPFNAFLSGFSATVGQFVLTTSLRMQTNKENEKEFSSVSDERAFADYVFGSLLLHFFCVNFIN